MDEKPPKGEGLDDDRYVLEDTGESIEEIEHEMELAAQEADHTAREPKVADTTGEAAGGEPTPDAAEWKNRYLRTLADFENYRKRIEREKAEYLRHALAGIFKELLPVLDNFDRALDHAEEGDDFHKGVLLIYKQLFDTLKKGGLRPIEESGIRFDPNIHEAVIREEVPSVPNQTVVEILQKGYFLHDRLLRPALVKVAVGGPERGDDVQ
ncbi:MAG TPA: nucleotide exchange factor GrpE [Thermoanaerobaculia bacterium]|nr:nucleotide exchange factor GrpE [Thermoanaerobaculia bacterium]